MNACLNCGCETPNRYCSSRCAALAPRPSSKPLIERFWLGVDKRGADDCWEWRRGRQRAGYGALTASITTHRYSWEVHNGPIPDGLHVLHKCDNPPCCNPKHLFLGTHHENMLDMARKRRHGGPGFRGSDHPRSKLTEEAVIAIRASAMPARKLAAQFGVTPETIYQIRLRQTWTHI